MKASSLPRKRNTVIEPWVDVDADVAEINAGRGERTGDTVTVNGRTYGIEAGGRLYPMSGPGFMELDRGAYKALRLYNTFGVGPEVEYRLQMEGIRPEQRDAALAAWRAGRRQT